MSIINVSSASTLIQALKVAQAGDTIALQSGTYTGVDLSNLKFAQDVVITSADPGKPAVLTSLTVSGSEGLTFRDLEFRVDPASGGNPFKVSGSKDIHFDGLNVHGTLNGNPSGDVDAFLIRDSVDISIRNSEFQQVATGIGVLNNKGLNISNNEFHDIRSDGIRGGGNSDVTVSNNTFTDFFPDAGDHPDAIQFWTTNTKVSAENYVISGNIISRGAGAPVQGIFLTDQSGGSLPYLNVKITDNLLIGVSWNGIFLNGKGGEIGGNTLISYADQASRIRVQNSDGVNIHDNGAGGYVYSNNVNVKTGANETTGAVSDGGAAALAKWLAAHPGVIFGIGSSEAPPVVEPVPPVVPPIGGDGGHGGAGDAGDNTLPPVGSNIDGLKLFAKASGGTLKGSARNDELQGAAGADRLEGGAGHDVLKGAGGNDTLYGGDGDDYMDGGSGDDVLYGGDGVNVLIGGSGNDTYVVTKSTDIIVELNGGGADVVSSSVDFVLSDNVETLRLTNGAVSGSGNGGDNLIVGNAGDNLLRGLDGNDRLEGGAGQDILDGGEGADTLYAGAGNDVLLGGGGNDNLGGDAGNDYMDGGAGDDLFYGGAGADTMIGGSGRDSFIFKTGDFVGGVDASMDVIRDFSSAEGDVIHLVSLDANVLTAANDAFKFIGTSQFHRVAGELRYEVAGGSAYVMGDVNGDGAADFKIQLIGVDALKAADFFL